MPRNKFLCFLLLWPGISTQLEFSNGNCSYYWTLYNGTTPEDAVLGGSETSGAHFYIALVQLKLINELFAGMIIPKTQTARITSLGITREVKNDPFTVVNILCSSTASDSFKWLSTKSENLHKIKNLVFGGKVFGQDLYIGRIKQDEGYLLGKVFPHKFIYQGLYVPCDGIFKRFMSYNVLSFKCEPIEVFN